MPLSPSEGKLDKEQDCLLRKGVDEYNRREFFECHETLEELWQDYHAADRELIQGVIQISVAYLHLTRGNRAGALKLFTRGLARAEKYKPNYFQLSISEFVDSVSKDLSYLAHTEEYRMEDLVIPTIEYISSSNDC